MKFLSTSKETFLNDFGTTIFDVALTFLRFLLEDIELLSLLIILGSLALDFLKLCIKLYRPGWVSAI